MITQEELVSICCPRIDPVLWENKILTWEKKKFIKDKVFTLFHIPMNFGKVMKRLDEKVRNAGANMPDWICLANHTSKWNMDVYLAVDQFVPEAENTTMSGKFFSKVYDGPFKDTGKWCKDFEDSAKTQDLNIDKWFMWYTTCPKCAKKYGHNYVVIMAKLK